MTKSVTITARITPALNKKLLAYAKAAKRSKSWLIEDMIDRYIDGEIAVVEAVNVGIREIDEGKGIPHDEVFRRLRIKSAKYRRTQRKNAA
jgi:predicted transcriptional regulator